ncbi:uncharacterized protein MELLADRAFT_67019 [Melampsora larici-populina 98AG31]|uniref:Uncharacterized protein n=1 Tax=Melampsora larici-populina (strain 98AG31 / pathotype 3-4-7) TaxID=747676 RepID=F4S1H7_MELLP|nr:uncharacterized protein MELLADRAFT_67019 [Melampsora larici-populina 98AG31]EGG01377.1 hypothetical protein MELLADRAFT_67019 [Melampsora larici-populina 98AG31]
MLENPPTATGVFVVGREMPAAEVQWELQQVLPAGTTPFQAHCMLSGVDSNTPHVMPVVLIYRTESGPAVQPNHLYHAHGRLSHDAGIRKMILEVSSINGMTCLGPSPVSYGQFIPHLVDSVSLSAHGKPIYAEVEVALDFGPEVVVLMVEHNSWFQSVEPPYDSLIVSELTNLNKHIDSLIYYRGEPGLAMLNVDDFNERRVNTFISGYIQNWDADTEELTIQVTDEAAGVM